MKNRGASGIGELNEQPLHAALKRRYARPGDRLEVRVDGYVIDVVQDGLLIEIQTGNFSSIKAKLLDLVARHSVRLVYPVAYEKWLLKRPKDGEGPRTRRKSPKRGTVLEIFEELVSFPELLCEPNFSLDVVLTQEEELRYHDPRRWRRHGWVVEERRLLDVAACHHFSSPEDVAVLLPEELPDPFTTRHLAEALGRSRRLAQKMTYCLRKMTVLVKVGQKRRAYLYRVSQG
jgi:hypothetical protein